MNKNLKFKIKNYQAGFTLIELLVTIAIVAIMMVVSIPAFGTYGERQKLNQAAEGIAAAIRQTQNYSLAPQSDKSDLTNAYEFECQSDSKDYKIQEYIDGVGRTPEIDPIKSESLPEGTYCKANSKIVFQLLNGKILDPANNNLEIIIVSDKTSTTKTILVNHETGQVEIK